MRAAVPRGMRPLLLGLLLVALATAWTCSFPDELTGYSGQTIKNPVGASTYEPISCTWNVLTPGMLQRFVFNNFALSCGDTLTISTTGNALTYSFDCSNPPLLNFPYNTTTDLTHVNFTSHATVGGAGFGVDYTTYQPTQCISRPDTPTPTFQALIDSPQTLSNPYPFGTLMTELNVACYWRIQAPNGYKVALSLLALDTGPSATVEFHDGQNIGDVRRSFEGTLAEQNPAALNYTSTGSYVEVWFDSVVATATGHGFVVQYYATQPLAVTGCGGQQVLYGNYGTIVPYTEYGMPGYNMGGFGFDCQWIITVDPEHYVGLTITYSLGPDDRLTIDSSMVYNDGTRNVYTNGMRTVGDYSFTQTAYIRLTSSSAETGFTLSWYPESFTADFPTACSSIVQYATLGAGAGHLAAGYGAESSCVWLINVNPMYQVQLKFSFSGSKNEVLKIYDGATAQGNVIAKVRGDVGASAVTVNSMSNFLFIRIVSDNANCFTGSFDGIYNTSARPLSIDDPASCPGSDYFYPVDINGTHMIAAHPCPWTGIAVYPPHEFFWTYTTAEGQALALMFSTYSMIHDYYIVYDSAKPGDINGGPRLLGIDQTRGLPPMGVPVVYSTDNFMSMDAYITNYNPGVVVTVFPISPACVSAAYQVYTATYSISNPPLWGLGNYHINGSCIHTLNGYFGQVIRVTIHDMEIAAGDTLTFYDGGTIAAGVLAVNPPAGTVLLSRSNVLYIVFAQNSPTDTDIGYRFDYIGESPTPLVTPGCNSRVIAPLTKTYFAFPTPFGQPSPVHDALSCFYQIVPEPFSTIEFQFNFIDMRGGEALDLHEGLVLEGPRVAGADMFTKPDHTYTSSVGFVLNAMLLYTGAPTAGTGGFMVSYRSVPLPIVQCDGTYAPITNLASGVFSNPSPYGADPNARYENNAICSWSVDGNGYGGEWHIEVTSDMDSSDYLYIFDGPDGTWPALASGSTFSGQTYLATNPLGFSVSFVSDSSGTGRGFQLSWRVNDMSVFCGESALMSSGLAQTISVPPRTYSKFIHYPAGLECMWTIQITNPTRFFNTRMLTADLYNTDNVTVAIVGSSQIFMQSPPMSDCTQVPYYSTAVVKLQTTAPGFGGAINLRFGDGGPTSCDSAYHLACTGGTNYVTSGWGYISYPCPGVFTGYTYQPLCNYAIQTQPGATVLARVTFIDPALTVQIWDGAVGYGTLLGGSEPSHVPNGTMVFQTRGNLMTIYVPQNATSANRPFRGFELSYMTSNGFVDTGTTTYTGVYISTSGTTGSNDAGTTAPSGAGTGAGSGGTNSSPNNVGAQVTADATKGGSSVAGAVAGGVVAVLIIVVVIVALIIIMKRRKAQQSNLVSSNPREVREPSSTRPRTADKPRDSAVEMGRPASSRRRSDFDEGGPPVRANPGRPPTNDEIGAPARAPRRSNPPPFAPSAPSASASASASESKSKSGSHSSSADEAPPPGYYDAVPNAIKTNCSACKAKLTPGSKFCATCGARV